MDIRNEKTYDSVFWTSVVKMTKFFIPLVNEAFGEHYTDAAKITLQKTKQALENPDGSFEQGEMDALAELSEMDVTKDYHFEVETWKDNTFAIRIAEYAAGAAYDSVKLTDDGAEMTIPYSAVIFLRSAESISDKLTIRIRYPGGIASYDAPVMKVRDYSISDLFEKKLLLLLPFFGFNFDDKFEQMETGGIDELKEALDEINSRLTAMVGTGEIDESQRNHLIDWMKRVLEKLTVNYKNVTKGVNDLMGGYILHTRTDDILDQGRSEGRKAGRDERDREKIAVMLRKGLKPEEVANYGDYPLQLVLEVERNLSTLA